MPLQLIASRATSALITLFGVMVVVFVLVRVVPTERYSASDDEALLRRRLSELLGDLSRELAEALRGAASRSPTSP